MKFKAISFIFLSIIGIYISLWFYLSSLLGYFLGKFFSGKKEDKPGRIKSLKIELEKHILHFHHWIFILGAIVLTYWMEFFKFPLPFYLSFLGFSSGLIFQEIYQYRDWYKVVKKRARSL